MLSKLNLAITMHEYPFNIVEHEYLVDFIKSLHPSFPIKSRVSVRKEIMDKYLEEKETLYAHLKTMKCRFSATWICGPHARIKDTCVLLFIGWMIIGVCKREI
jgi:hypothetical protein